MGRLDSCAALPAPSSTRLLARDDAFHQSTGKLIVRPTNLPRQSSRTLRRQQAFFLVLGMRTWKLIALVIFAHVFSFVLFAPFFYLVSDEDICDLGVGFLWLSPVSRTRSSLQQQQQKCIYMYTYMVLYVCRLTDIVC